MVPTGDYFSPQFAPPHPIQRKKKRGKMLKKLVSGLVTIFLVCAIGYLGLETISEMLLISNTEPEVRYSSQDKHVVIVNLRHSVVMNHIVEEGETRYETNFRPGVYLIGQTPEIKTGGYTTILKLWKTRSPKIWRLVFIHRSITLTPKEKP